MIVNVKEMLPIVIRRLIKNNIHKVRSAGKQKVFGIGDNKTGTTSLKFAMEELGFIVGHQEPAERMLEDWANRDFKRIVQYCNTAQFFQDIPFSNPYTFVILDHEFPGSKFILTVRDSPKQWYNSLVKFHAKKWGRDGRVPTKEDLQQANYLEKGWPWRENRLSYDSPEDDPYNTDILIQHHVDYNNSVKEYFRHRPEDLLVLNVAEGNAYQKLCNFLGLETIHKTFPWKNKTE